MVARTKSPINKIVKKKSDASRAAVGQTRLDKRNKVKSLPIDGFQGRGLVSLGSKSKLELREILAMTRPMFSRVVDVSERTIAEVEAGKTAKKLMRRYNEVYRLVEAISEVVDRNYVGTWFRTPNKSFDGLKPLEVIERGEIDRLWNMVFQLRSGMPG